MNWCLFGSCVGCIPILLLFKEHYGRLVVDNGIEVKVTDDGEEIEGRCQTKSVFTSTLSISGVELFIERLYRSKESTL